MFTAIRPFPRIAHITDNMGVSFTLIEGTDKALLFDTGYGLENVRDYIGTLTDKPVKVLLSHGHHDHMLGARWFPETFLCEQDMEEFRERTGHLQRTKIKKQAESKGIMITSDFMEAGIPLPQPIHFTEETGTFESTTENLGGTEALIIHVPGHTPGSIVVSVPEYRLLLTGDNWNPCTWMWFPSSLSAAVWRENMICLIRTLENWKGIETDTVLCSHQPVIRDGDELRSFLDYMTVNRMENADPVDMGAPIHTCMIRKEEKNWTLIFDKDKI